MDIGGILTVFDSEHRVLLGETAFASVALANTFATKYFDNNPAATLALYAPHNYALRSREVINEHTSAHA
jgi:hypothetical protein